MPLKRLPKSHATGELASKDANGIAQEVLVVDDEPNVLHVVERVLTEEFAVRTASGGEDGLKLLKSNSNIAVIVSDQRMPGMTGTEFLNRSMDIKPDCIRIILTGYTDVKDLIESINSGRVFQYMNKPFEPEALKIVVRRGLDYYTKNKQLEIAHGDLKKAYEDLKRAQEHLVRSEKMSMLGQLMGSISHEIRNPITNIGNSVKLLGMDWQTIKEVLLTLNRRSAEAIPIKDFVKSMSGELNIENTVNDFEAAMHIITHSCELVSEIVEDLRGFSRLDNAEFVRTDLHLQIDRALTLLRSKFKHRVEFRKDFGRIPMVMGLPGPISQVMINIINNAAQAIPGDGMVRIQTSHNDGYAVVAISDNGVGISEEHLNKIFDVGFTTKTDREGTGLGLTISYEIMQKHNGKIEVESKVRKGSIFRLFFPVEKK